ncbi:splicing factor PWI domain-containing protein / RNA recognition motif (RRM)-containing protein isoform X2 [Carex rostrata]
MPRFPIQFPGMMRPGFAPRPIPLVARPPMPGMRPGPAPPIMTPARPIAPVPLVEKPQTTVYVGKIASTVDNDFLLSLLRLCGPVKSWKRAQDPSNNTPKSFAFCEFEAAEGILRALRLLTKLNLDGQELVLNINQATRDYLEKYVVRKTEREKLKETEALLGDLAAEGIVQHPTENDASKPITEEPKKESESPDNKEEIQDETQKFGIVNDDDRAADKEALEKITEMVEERAKTLPPPPPRPVEPPANLSAKSQPEIPSKSRERDDADAAKSESAGDKTNEETASENKTANEADKPEASSPDKGNRSRRERSRERDREKDRGDLKRERDREADRYEREKERDRIKREREREERMRQSDRLLKDRLRDWENRERDREHHRLQTRDKEKEKEKERKREVLRQEEETDDEIDSRKRRRRGGVVEDRKRKRQREKDEDVLDRLKEEEELADEARRREIEEEKRREEEKAKSERAMDMFMQDMVSEIAAMKQQRPSIDRMEVDAEQDNGDVHNGADADELHLNNHDIDMSNEQNMESNGKQNNIPPSKKLGFGLFGSGRRASVPSVFHAEEDEDVEEKKMRPLVPIDYSEELQAVQEDSIEAPNNIMAAAEFAKRISGANPKEEKLRSGDRSNHREREEKQPKSETKKVLDAKQLIDMIPRTKEELFAFEVNWTVYDKHEIHERMRPWVSKKITEFLGEEEETLVDYIVSCTKDHVQASKMLELLQAILDEEAEMFVLKMWRMLIFEIMKVETGLPMKSRS